MGWTPVNKISLTRDFNTREIVVNYHDDVTGDHQKRFAFAQSKEAIEFVAKVFNEVAM